jgi:MFS family permease
VAVWPATATRDARLLVATRALRGLADGAVSVVLASYLTLLGLSPLAVGAIVTSTLLGSAALTLAVGLLGQGRSPRRLLIGASALMVLTGVGFAEVRAFWPLLVIAFVGTMNPSAGDVSVFLPTEQAVLSAAVGGPERTLLFALYNLAGTLAGALGALGAGVPGWLAHHRHWPLLDAHRTLFLGYALIAVGSGLIYRRLSPAVERPPSERSRRPLARSRGIVIRLAALFSLDSLGGGFVVQSLLALWLYRRFGLSIAATGTAFFAMGVLAAGSQIVSARLAGRIGLINTMVFTHLPANVFLIVAALMPTPGLAILFLLLRMALSQMDVPARQAYVMGVVPPEERPAASSVTNVPRSLAAAVTPLIAGALLERSTFGWPLVCGGLVKATYDLLLLAQFRAVPPREEG